VGELTFRPYQAEDAAALTHLLNTVEVHGGGRAGWSAPDVAENVRAGVADYDTDTRLVLDGAELVAAALVTTPPPGGYRVNGYGGVLPGYRGRGLGRDLLAWQYERARQLHAANDPGATWQLEVGVMRDDTSARRLAERLGFTVARYYFEMVAESAAGPEPKLPAGLDSVVPGRELARALYEAHMEAFADHWGFQRREYDKWISTTLESSIFRPAQSRVALDGGEIAGYVLGYTDGDPQRLYIGQVGTRRAWRNRGVASALLAEVLRAAAEAGLPAACLGVDADSLTGAVGVYERAGFAVEDTFVAYRRAITP
jgi:mycothiol synthase